MPKGGLSSDPEPRTGFVVRQSPLGKTKDVVCLSRSLCSISLRKGLVV